MIAQPGQERFSKPIEDDPERQCRSELYAQRHVPGAETPARQLTARFVDQLTELVVNDPREDLVRQERAG